jgi:hypothetical protein
MSSSKRARRSGLVFGFVAASKTSGLPHKRRLTSWTPPRNDPNRSWPNCLMSSTRRARRSALDFVGLVIVISKNPLTDRAPARRHDRGGSERASARLDFDRCGGAPPNEAGGGGHRRVLANFLRVFKTSLSCPDPAASQFHFWGRKRTPIEAPPHHPIDTAQCRPYAARLRRPALDLDCGRPKRLGGRRRPRR